jgi:hypothetical protein
VCYWIVILTHHVTYATQAPLSHTFVSSILKTVFENSKKPYPRKIVEYLIKQKVVGNGMVDGGLLLHLQEQNDWV